MDLLHTSPIKCFISQCTSMQRNIDKCKQYYEKFSFPKVGMIKDLWFKRSWYNPDAKNVH